MIRTQVQLPDRLYRDLRALAEQHEWSLAEAVRRGAELLIRSYPVVREPIEEWSLPDPMELGDFVAPVEAWRALAHERGD